MTGYIQKILQKAKDKPVRALFLAIVSVAFINSAWICYSLATNPLDPNNSNFNSKYFRFENYGSDPFYMEEVARKVFPKGMPEEAVDDILITDLFVTKSYKSPLRGHVFYTYVSAPWRLLNHSHSALYDESRRLIDIFPENGRGVYSGVQLDELISRAQQETPK